MLEYILRRILIFIPTLILISLFTFLLSVNAPGDPVEQILGGVAGTEGRVSDLLATEKAYREVAHKLGLDLPIFYFSIVPASVPDTLYRIPNRLHKQALRRLISQLGNWEDIQAYYHAIREARLACASLPIQAPDTFLQARRALYELLGFLPIEGDTAQVKHKIQEMHRHWERLTQWLTRQCAPISAPTDTSTSADTALLHFCQAVAKPFRTFRQAMDTLFARTQAMFQHATPWKNYIPTFHWYGLNNQYHRWISGILRGDFGISYQDLRPVTEVIVSALRWTVLINLCALILIYLIAIPAGVDMAVHKYSLRDRLLSLFFYILYSLPNFWVATLLIIFFASGVFLSWFPPFGVQSVGPEAPWWIRTLDIAHHLVLPVICLAYGSLAFLARQMRGSMLDALSQDYVRTARAKGLDERTVIWKHAFRNSLLPIITLFANVFPYMVSGSFVIEYIFSIPGMGKVSYEAIFARNYPVVYAVVLLTAVMTLIGYLVADILYAVVDPRITYRKR